MPSQYTVTGTASWHDSWQYKVTSCCDSIQWHHALTTITLSIDNIHCYHALTVCTDVVHWQHSQIWCTDSIHWHGADNIHWREIWCCDMTVTSCNDIIYGALRSYPDRTKLYDALTAYSDSAVTSYSESCVSIQWHQALTAYNDIIHPQHTLSSLTCSNIIHRHWHGVVAW